MLNISCCKKNARLEETAGGWPQVTPFTCSAIKKFEIRSTKSEARNPKQIQMIKTVTYERFTCSSFSLLRIRI
ncbi:MAG: hypothetical protein CVU57_17190 [Deltaproteobacteria bacterium HGW-Deltaproteobacteria-15]|nr:MAG: hypothetical protein CVU57_17190 [Deltaproteobacteria bacterium HGW-Deltaproteobacteria-15]